MERHVLPGSHHEPHPDHMPHSKCHPHDDVEVTVWMKPHPSLGAVDVHRILGHGLQAHWNGYSVARGDQLTLSGTVAQMESAFGVTLHHLHHPDGGTYRGHLGPISVPAELKDIVTGVFGLDDRPVAKPHFRKGGRYPLRRAHADIKIPNHKVVSDHISIPTGAFTPPELAKLYQFPEGDGTGQAIAIIELGGGFKPADLKTYFAEIGVREPSVTAVSVDGGKNQPDGPDGADGEVMLDIEVAGAVAPGAKIVVYFAPNTDRGFMDSVARAIHDPVHKPSVISISWGGPENSWTASAMKQFDMILAQAGMHGVTVTVAAGDNGSDDGVGDGVDHADFPASSPHVLACGGTTLVANGGYIASEVVWNDGPGNGATGGGFSSIFDQPDYQSKVNDTPAPYMRGVPDVAAVADPNTGYYVRVDGQDTVIGGTSACAPLFAGLIAICNQINGKRAGKVNGALYQHPEAFHDITSGNNGDYSAGPGWDPTTGLGSPIGTEICKALAG